MDGRVRCGVIGLMVSTGVAVSSSQTPNLAAMAGCWRAQDLTKQATLKWTSEILGEKAAGDCPVEASESWQVCLNEGDNRTVGGTASVFQSRKTKTNVADPGAGIVCMSLVGVLGYGQSFSVKGAVEGSNLRLTLEPENCVTGKCPKASRQGTLSQRGTGLLLVLDDQSQIPLEKPR